MGCLFDRGCIPIRATQGRGGVDVPNRRGDSELMGEVNSNNAVFLERTTDGWRECEACSAKWHTDEDENKAQRSIKRMLGVKLK